MERGVVSGVGAWAGGLAPPPGAVGGCAPARPVLGDPASPLRRGWGQGSPFPGVGGLLPRPGSSLGSARCWGVGGGRGPVQ